MGRRVVFGITGLLVLSGLIGAACGSGTRAASTGPAEGKAVLPAATSVADAAGSGIRDVSAGNAAPGSAVSILSPRVIKTASLSVRVKDGSFDQRFQEATQIAARFGGFVSSSATEAGRRRSGTIVVRIPATQFEAALGAIKALGTVTRQDVTGQDVTAQFVDLEARLKNWQAQEAVLLTLMAKATSIQDSIRVQQNLQDVQLSIEELKGQLRVLNDQADYSTITVGIAEAGFVAPTPKEGGVLSRAWHRAVDGFLSVIAAVVVGLGYVLPLGLVLALAWLVVRRVRPRVARPA